VREIIDFTEPESEALIEAIDAGARHLRLCGAEFSRGDYLDSVAELFLVLSTRAARSLPIIGQSHCLDEPAEQKDLPDE